MAKCSLCGETETLPFTCKFCGRKFCGEHRLPENHQCPGLEKFKENRTKGIEEWIYEPFRKEYKDRAGRVVKPSLQKRVKESLLTMDMRRLLYAIIVLIIILTIFMGFRG